MLMVNGDVDDVYNKMNFNINMSRNHSRNIHTWVNSSCYICVQKQLYIIQTSYIYIEIMGLVHLF